MDIFLIILLGCALIISVEEDLRRLKIPNMVTYPTMVLAIGYHGLSSGLSGFAISAGGLALGIGIFIIPYLLGGMGAGDAKLMGAAGAVFGPKGVLISSILVIVAGGVYGFILYAMHPKYLISFMKRFWMAVKTLFLTHQFIPVPPGKEERQPILRFALPIALGTMFYAYLKITGNNPIPQFMGFQFSI